MEKWRKGAKESNVRTNRSTNEQGMENTVEKEERARER